MQCFGLLGGSRDFKARNTAKEHTNEAQSGGRDLGVSRPLLGRPLDMGNCCVVAFRHGALNWQGAPTFTAPLAVDRLLFIFFLLPAFFLFIFFDISKYVCGF